MIRFHRNISVQDILLLSLSAWYVISWQTTGCGEVGHAIIQGFIPYAMLYIGIRLLAYAEMEFTEISIAVALGSFCIWESCYGLGQVFGLWPSGSSIFAMTGHFSNPGPYGGYVASLTAIALSYLCIHDNIPKFLRVFLIVEVVFGALVLPASLSRAAWAGLAIGVGATLATVRKYRKIASSHPAICIALVLIIVAIAVGAIFLKVDSALGRVHIWHMDFRAMFKQPLLGAGPGFGLGTYGIMQENWFMANPEEMVTWRARVAGCPEYAFNELLGIGMEVGIPGFLLAITVIVVSVITLLLKHSPLAAGLICSSVFSCASYPLSFPLFAALFITLLAIAGVSGNQWPNKYCKVLSTMAGVGFIFGGCIILYSHRNTKSRPDLHDLFENGRLLYAAERYEESIEVLTEGRRMSSDIMFGVVIGRCQEALGNMDEAEKEYRTAHYRAPCRLYPLVRLMRLQVKTGKNKDAIETAESILDMPVNSRHAAMMRLHVETQSCLDSLIFLTDNAINSAFR